MWKEFPERIPGGINAEIQLESLKKSRENPETIPERILNISLKKSLKEYWEKSLKIFRKKAPKVSQEESK